MLHLGRCELQLSHLTNQRSSQLMRVSHLSQGHFRLTLHGYTIVLAIEETVLHYFAFKTFDIVLLQGGPCKERGVIVSYFSYVLCLCVCVVGNAPLSIGEYTTVISAGKCSLQLSWLFHYINLCFLSPSWTWEWFPLLQHREFFSALIAPGGVRCRL